MLILNRRLVQSIIINGNIEIIYSDFDFTSHTIKLAINAPVGVVVDRKEIHEKKLKNEPWVK